MNVLIIHVSAISWLLYEKVLVLGENGDLIGKHSQKWETSHCELDTSLDRILSERRTSKLLHWKDSLLFCGYQPFKHFNQPCTNVIFINAWCVWDYSVQRHFQQYFSYIAAVRFIGGWNRSTQRKPPILSKSLTNFII